MDDFVLVRGPHDTVTGIVTTAEVVRVYGQLATPFFVMGELDRLLRALVSESFPLDLVTGICDPGGSRISGYDDLSMGHFVRVLEYPTACEMLGWPLDRTAVTRQLDKLPVVRNDICTSTQIPFLTA